MGTSSKKDVLGKDDCIAYYNDNLKKVVSKPIKLLTEEEKEIIAKKYDDAKLRFDFSGCMLSKPKVADYYGLSEETRKLDEHTLIYLNKRLATRNDFMDFSRRIGKYFNLDKSNVLKNFKKKSINSKCIGIFGGMELAKELIKKDNKLLIYSGLIPRFGMYSRNKKVFLDLIDGKVLKNLKNFVSLDNNYVGNEFKEIYEIRKDLAAIQGSSSLYSKNESNILKNEKLMKLQDRRRQTLLAIYNLKNEIIKLNNEAVNIESVKKASKIKKLIKKKTQERKKLKDKFKEKTLLELIKTNGKEIFRFFFASGEIKNTDKLDHKKLREEKTLLNHKEKYDCVHNKSAELEFLLDVNKKLLEVDKEIRRQQKMEIKQPQNF